MAASSRLGVLMKLDKNQRKPRVFKASDLCPHYNRRVDAAYNAGCFHIQNLLCLTELPAEIVSAISGKLCMGFLVVLRQRMG